MKVLLHLGSTRESKCLKIVYVLLVKKYVDFVVSPDLCFNVWYCTYVHILYAHVLKVHIIIKVTDYCEVGMASSKSFRIFLLLSPAIAQELLATLKLCFYIVYRLLVAQEMPWVYLTHTVIHSWF